MYKNKKNTIMIVLLVCLMLISSCQKKENIEVNLSVIDSMKQFDLEDKYEFDSTIYHIRPNEIIEFQAKKFDYKNAETLFEVSPLNPDKDWKKPAPVHVFTDITLKSPLPYYYVWYSHKDKKITLTPEGEIVAKKDFLLSDGRDESVTISGVNKWGCFHTLYVVIYNDLKTGKALEKPIVKTYQIDHENELPAPILSYSISNLGELKLSWTEVENATKYYIIALKYSNYDGEDKKYQMWPELIAETTKTTWESYPDNLEELSSLGINNWFVSRVNRDEDQLYDELENSFVGELKNVKNIDPSNIYVIAANDKQQSPLSNAIAFRDIGDKIPHDIAVHTMIGEVGSYTRFESWDDLPSYVPVTMASGVVNFLPITILEDKIVEKKNGDLILYYGIKGTPFTEFFLVKNDSSDFLEKAKLFNENTEKSAATGSLPTLNIEKKYAENINSKVVGDSIPKLDIPVFGTTDFSYYLAANLLNNVDVIDLEAFGREITRDELYDSLDEVRYQNPLISLVDKFDLSNDERYLIVNYFDKDRDIRIKKQKEIKEHLDSAVVKIQQKNLEGVEQIREINRYICLNGEYDWEAYEKKDIMNKEELWDAFDTYGIAVKGKGVCISYAQAFNYISRQLGLNSILVTGFINGSVDRGHAWNAIKLDGRWKYFDPTWNDRDNGYSEDYFNIEMEDSIFSKTHTLDSYYLVDRFLELFTNP